MKSLVSISACIFVIIVLCIINHCYGKSIYVNYEGVDEPENDLVRRRKQSLERTETVQSGRGGGENYNLESPSEQNFMTGTDIGRDSGLDLHKMMSTSDLKIGTSPWLVPVPNDDDNDNEDDVDRRMAMSTKNHRRQSSLTRKFTTPRSTYHDQDEYGRWTNHNNNIFRPSSPWSSRQRSFFFGGVGGPKKRQSILYRQCFFNPISCFK